MNDDKKKLLWINHFAMPPGEGGGTRHFEMSQELVSRGWDVTVAMSDLHYHSRRYTRRDGPEDRRVIREDIEGVRLRYLWSAPYERNDWHRGWNWLSFANELRKWSPDAGRPDIVVGSSPHLFAALMGERRATRWSVPFVFEVRDLWPESMVAAGGSKGAVFTGFKWIANYLYKRASGIICLARGTREYLRDEFDIPSDKLFFVPNGVSTSTFGSRKAYERDIVTFVYAGAHGPANGLDVVVEAANLLRHRDDLRFLLVGDGPAKQSLQQLARDLGTNNVEFLGTVPKSEVLEVFRRADAGLMVLRETPLFAFGVSPNKLFDYMGAALPVVSNVPGEVAWMVEQAEAGEQASGGSPEELAAAIERLADRSAEERAQLGRSGRAWVTREHSRAVLAERLDGVLRNLL